jgi:hydroxycarboxylate dehydrogenase B
MPLLQGEFLRTAIRETFVALGVSDQDAAIVAAHLVDAELTGVSSHGVIRVPQYVRAVREGRVQPAARLSVLRETGATAALDGGGGFGQVMVAGMVEKALELSSKLGAGVVTLVNCGHTGRLGHYTEQAAARGHVAMMFANAGGHGQWVAPFGGTSGRLSTNPFSLAAPSGGDFPLVLDVATSIAPEGKVRALQAAGQQLPAGWVIRHDGQPTTDPADLYGPPRGAILPMGGHKGFGLSMLIDALAGGLSGAGCCTDPGAPMDGRTDGVLFVAIRPNAFLPPEQFLQQVEALIAHVKSSPPAPGVTEVLAPGEREFCLRAARDREGVFIDDEIWNVVSSALR